MSLEGEVLKLLKQRVTKTNKVRLIAIYYTLLARFSWLLYIYGKLFHGPILKLIRRGRRCRRLEIGPGPRRLPGFETVNIVWAPGVDYVANASRRIPFGSETFKLIYASHILEHIPWYQTESALAEWYRVLEPGGDLELWVPDGLKIAAAWVAAEQDGAKDFHADPWWKFNANQDPAVWANGRLFSYGDGFGTLGHQNWHLSAFSERHLKDLLIKVGFKEVEVLDRKLVRGNDHGWINLGFKATK